MGESKKEENKKPVESQNIPSDFPKDKSKNDVQAAVDIEEMAAHMLVGPGFCWDC